MRRFALIVVMLGACEKKAPRYEGPLRVALGFDDANIYGGLLGNEVLHVQ